MTCPFFKETSVRYCRQSPIRKMIVERRGKSVKERCSSTAYAGCAIYQSDSGEEPVSPRCPLLVESQVQYCAAASVPQYIPASESLLTRCGTGAHRYCETYLSIAQPAASFGPVPPPLDTHEPGESWVDGVRVPNWLHYAPNHMWMEVTADGGWHIGIDAFLGKILRRVDQVSFLTTRGVAQPAAVLTVRGVDLPFIFPKRVAITAVNSYLRSEPEKLTAEPYTLGWLFEGSGDADAGSPADLIDGESAPRWIAREIERVSEFVHEAAAANGTMADGGRFSSDFVDHLGREELLRFFHEFFSPLRKA